MTYSEWCIKYIGPIVDQWNDGVITLEELTSAIVYNVSNRTEDWIHEPEPRE